MRLCRGRRLPTSIYGLSPNSRFLQALNPAPLVSPAHSIIGKRDDVAPAKSARLESALSELLVPDGHGGFAHPKAIQEIKPILVSTEGNGKISQHARFGRKGPGLRGESWRANSCFK